MCIGVEAVSSTVVLSILLPESRETERYKTSPF